MFINPRYSLTFQIDFCHTCITITNIVPLGALCSGGHAAAIPAVVAPRVPAVPAGWAPARAPPPARPLAQAVRAQLARGARTPR